MRRACNRLVFFLVRQGGFEPPADCLEGNCSIHLSYWRTRKKPHMGPHAESQAGVWRLLLPGERSMLYGFRLAGLAWISGAGTLAVTGAFVVRSVSGGPGPAIFMKYRGGSMRFSSFHQFTAYLDSLGLFSMCLGLGRMENALDRMALARPAGTVVHVVGTNGKGSTSGFLAALARAHGLRTGLYTSPHLVSVRERVRVGGRMLPEERWLGAANAVMARCADVGLTYFELVTVMALHLFRAEGVDFIVLEAGLGGTHDATCAVAADLAVMTPVGLDHEAVLGPGLADIARDKSGALGRCPAVIGAQEPEVRRIFERAGALWPLRDLEEYRTPGGFVFGPEGVAISAAALPGHPPYQVHNAALAFLAWNTLAGTRGWQSVPGLCTMALEKTRFSGRFRRHGRVLVDGAHNAMGLAALCEALETGRERFQRLVFQCMRDKALPDEALFRLQRLADETVIPRLPLERASEPAELARRFGPGAAVADSLTEALGCDQTVLVCGSLYLAGAYYAAYPEHLEA